MVCKIIMTHLYIILGSTFTAFVGNLKVLIGLTAIRSPEKSSELLFGGGKQ